MIAAALQPSSSCFNVENISSLSLRHEIVFSTFNNCFRTYYLCEILTIDLVIDMDQHSRLSCTVTIFFERIR